MFIINEDLDQTWTAEAGNSSPDRLDVSLSRPLNDDEAHQTFATTRSEEMTQ